MVSPLAVSRAFKPSSKTPAVCVFPPFFSHLIRIFVPTEREMQLNGFSKFKRLTFHRNLKGFVLTNKLGWGQRIFAKEMLVQEPPRKLNKPKGWVTNTHTWLYGEHDLRIEVCS